MASTGASMGGKAVAGQGLFTRQSSGLVRELGIPAATGIALASAGLGALVLSKWHGRLAIALGGALAFVISRDVTRRLVQTVEVLTTSQVPMRKSKSFIVSSLDVGV